MNQKLKRKLANLIISIAFNYETSSTLDVLDHMGVALTEEEAEEITAMAAEVFDRYRRRAKGWEALLPKEESR